jgi:hypothetical protein
VYTFVESAEIEVLFYTCPAAKSKAVLRLIPALVVLKMLI